jgi:DNA-directed RNA polymerase alpha subunit
MQQNIFLTCKESRIESNRSFYGCFSIGPFDSSHSLTIANSLRRTLLSDCLGFGIISVIINNVTHEYSTIPGMRESVLDLILNLKELVFKKKKVTYSLYKGTSNFYKKIGSSYLKPFFGFLKVKGPGVIRAKDLKIPFFIECVDPEQYIATLAEDGFLSIKFVIIEGKGYLLQNKTKEYDSIFKLNTTQTKNRLNFIKEIKNSIMSTVPKGEKQTFLCPSIFKSKSESESELESERGNGFSRIGANPEEVGAGLGSSLGAGLGPYPYPSANPSASGKVILPLPLEDKTKNEKIFKNKLLADNTWETREDISVLNKDLFEKKSVSSGIQLDTVFNPIIKVSYLIEDFDNKIIEDLHEKANFINDITNLFESNNFVQKNFDFLKQEVKINHNKIFNFVDTYSITDIRKMLNNIHPIKKQESLHNIVIEIWTNGSLHPRDALYTALNNLASTFLNMKKTQSYDSIFYNEPLSSFLKEGIGIYQNLPPKKETEPIPYQNLSLIQNTTDFSSSVGFAARRELLGTSPEEVGQNLGAGLGAEAPYPSSFLQPANPKSKNLNQKPIEILNIPLRPYILLKKSNIHTVSDLSNLTIEEIQFICGFNNNYVKSILYSLEF